MSLFNIIDQFTQFVQWALDMATSILSNFGTYILQVKQVIDLMPDTVSNVCMAFIGVSVLYMLMRLFT